MAYVRSMKISRRSFIGGALGSLTLIFGGFGWREGEEPDMTPYTATEMVSVLERASETMRMLDENTAGEPRFILVTDRQYEELCILNGTTEVTVWEGAEVVRCPTT